MKLLLPPVKFGRARGVQPTARQAATLLPPVKFRRARGGWALMIVMVLAVGALLVVGSVLSWSNVSANITARNNEFYATTYAAEGATEKILSAIVADYENYGEPIVFSRLSTYSNYIPTASDDAYWGNYTFTAGWDKPMWP